MLSTFNTGGKKREYIGEWWYRVAIDSKYHIRSRDLLPLRDDRAHAGSPFLSVYLSRVCVPFPLWVPFQRA